MYEIEQKIGRNVLLFQRMEAILKHLLAYGNVAGYPGELESCLQERVSSLAKQTMGTLTRQFNSEILSSAGTTKTEQTEPEELAGIWVSFGFRIENDNLEDSLGSIVFERNKLIHHLLSEMDLTSPDEMRAAIEYLDQQHEKAQLICEDLRDMANFLHEGRQMLAAYFASEAGKKYCDLWFVRGRRVMGLLNDVARDKARSDGWAELSTAGQIIGQKLPEEFALLKAAYGQRTLKGFLLVTDWFELSEEPTSNGGVRVLYRRKPEQIWQANV